MYGSMEDRAAASPKRALQRPFRWIVVASVPLLLLSLLVATMQNWSTVQAAAIHEVGDCNGSGLGSIQEAVDLAVGGDIIEICPGNYAESVNLSNMSSIGDITLRKATGQPGTVLIDPDSGNGIFIEETGPFIGNITIEDISITGGEYGIKLSDCCLDGTYIIGNVILRRVTANENGEDGALIYALGAVTVENSTFNSNGFYGLFIESDDTDGADTSDVPPDIYLNHVIADFNEDTGIFLEANGEGLRGPHNVEVYNTQANSNGTVNNVGFGSGTGIEIEHDDDTMCPVSQAPLVLGPGRLHIEAVTANNNLGSWGMYVSGSNISILDSEANNNPYDGIAAFAGRDCDSYGDLQVTNSTAISNGWGVALAKYSEVKVQIPLDEFQFGGFRLLSFGELRVNGGNIAEQNDDFGYCYLTEYGSAHIENSRAANNGGDGFHNSFFCAIPFQIGRAAEETALDSPQPEVGVTNGVFPTHVISNSSAIANGGFGFAIDATYVEANLVNITAQQNITGVAFSDSSGMNMGGLGASGVMDSAFPIVIQSGIRDSLIQGNANVGVQYALLVDDYQLLDAQQIITSSHNISSSIICENGPGVGLGLLAEQFQPIIYDSGFSGEVGAQTHVPYVLNVDARGNWWGSTTGPFNAATNPTGQGNAVQFTAFDVPTNTANVQFAPWINVIDASAQPNPTLLGIPVVASYQFRDSATSYFLENGVGDPNNGPIFTLNATNGTPSGPLGTVIDNTLIEEIFTPANPGFMTLNLTGPCGLASSQQVLIAAPDIEVEKSPDLQGVAAGESATFTVTVFNTGNVTLTDVSVADALVPACARVVNDIPPNGQISYTCSANNVQNNFDNTVLAKGQALINGVPAGTEVQDTDIARVRVASFDLAKTVFVDGFKEPALLGGPNASECALHSSIFVPVGSTVKYCYTITNTGDYTLSVHSLVDSHFPALILNNFPFELGPGESFSTVDAGVQVTKTLSLEPDVSTTNVATWTAQLAAPILTLDAQQVDATIALVAASQATVTISSGDMDQDEDGIPDNIEGTSDLNNNGIPAFLDPVDPTNEPPTDQPTERREIFLPSLSNNE